MRVKRQSWKWLLLGGSLTFLVLFGMELSTKGIESIYGPMENGESQAPAVIEETYADDTERRIAELERELAEIRELAYGESGLGSERLPGMPYTEDHPAVNKLADSASGALQSASSKGIRFVVSFFEGIME